MSSGEASAYRPDIDGLRAVAVLLILLFHAGLSQLPGGYVGVDVFFVISGFLITGLLVKELEGTGTIDLPAFYARRARRILPASFVVLTATLLGAFVLLSPIKFWDAAKEIAASAAYVPNLLFARRVVDYFHPEQVSPVIHYWSLGVEEQFYLVYPAFLLLAVWLGRRVGALRGVGLAGWIGAATAASLALAVIATGPYPEYSFYLLPTRAWELGAGGLLVFAGPRLRGLPAWAAHTAAAAGLLLIGGSAVLFDASTPFPGVAALAPVLGAVLVIGAGSSAATPWSSAILASGPARYVGRISYSLYLWHWPLLVFLPFAPAAVALTFVLAAATYRFVEDPMRHGRLVGRRPRLNLASALVASALLVAVSLGTGKLAVARFEPVPGVRVMPEVGGADTLAGFIPATGPTVDAALQRDTVPDLLHPFAGELGYDPGDHPECSLREAATVNGTCTLGNPVGTKVVLFGDSHLVQWWAALERIMQERDWQVVFVIKASCTYADVLPATLDGRPKDVCVTWRRTAMERIEREQPDLVILSANHRSPPIVDGRVLAGDEADAAMAEGARRTIEALRALGATVAVLGDTPQVPWDPEDCLSVHADHLIRCAQPMDAALDLSWQAAERGAAEAAGATFVDTAQWVCPSDPCPAVIGRYVVYADTNHLTHPFVAALTSRLSANLPR